MRDSLKLFGILGVYHVSYADGMEWFLILFEIEKLILQLWESFSLEFTVESAFVVNC